MTSYMGPGWLTRQLENVTMTDANDVKERLVALLHKTGAEAIEVNEITWTARGVTILLAVCEKLAERIEALERRAAQNMNEDD